MMSNRRLSFRTLTVASVAIAILVSGINAFPSLWTTGTEFAAAAIHAVSAAVPGNNTIATDLFKSKDGSAIGDAATPATERNVLAPTGAVYVWNQTGTGSFGTTSNWTPARTTPLTDDVLTFNNGSTTTVTNIPTQTVGQILVSGNTSVTLQSAGTVTLSIGGDSGTDLAIASGSALTTTGSNAINVVVASGATGSISGRYSVTGGAHRLNAADASGITFNSGAIFTQDTGSTGNVFTTAGTANAIVFASGSTFVQNSGAHPFGLAVPNSKVVFQTGSLFSYRQTTLPPFSGRTYANFELNAAGASLTATGSGTLNVDDLTLTAGSMNLDLTGAININGNLFVASGTTLGFNGSPASSITFKGNISVSGTLGFAPGGTPTYTLNGINPQTIGGAGTITFNGNQFINISNSAGVNLQRNLDVAGAPLALTGSGRLNFGTSFISGTGSTFATSSSSAIGIGSPDGIATGTTTGNIRVSGPRTYSSGTTFIYNGSANQIVGNGLPAAVTNLTLSNAGIAGNNTVTGNAGQTVSNLLTVQSGSYASGAGTTTYGNVQIDSGATFSAGGRSDVSGNWTNSGGTFTANSNNVNFISSFVHTISGDTTFYNFVNIVNAASILNFGAGSTTTVTNQLNLSATSGSLSLRSTTSATRWKINSLGTNSLAGLDVQDSDASGGSTINAFGSVDSGNNLNWSFGPPEIAVAPASMTFGTQPVGSTSGTRSVTITNSGTGSLNIGQLTKGGTNPEDFTITSNPSNTAIAAGGTAKVQVMFTPGGTGSRTAQITIPSNDADEPNTVVSVSGAGTAAVTPDAVKSMWVWNGTPNPVTDVDGRTDLISSSSANGITDLYVSVYQPVPNTDGRLMYESGNIAPLISAAHTAGIKVWATYGDSAFQDQPCAVGQFAYTRMQEVAAYNSAVAADEKFDGVMLDVEPGVSFNLTNYANMHTCFRGILPSDIKLGTAISAFWSTSVEYPIGGESKPAFQHIIDLPLDQVVVMGYRDNAGAIGGNGIIGLDEGEISYASSIGKAGLILAGLETKDLGVPAEENVTFYEEGSAVMDSESGLVAAHFASSEGFGGFSVHAYQDEFASGVSGWPVGNNPPECTASTVQGAVGTASYAQDVDLVCTDSDGTIALVTVNSVTGGPATATVSVNQTTHIVTLTPNSPALATSLANPYVVSYTVTDNGGATTASTITVFVYDPPTTNTLAVSNVTAVSATLNGTAVTNVIFSTISARFRYGTTDPGICSDAFGTRAPGSGGSTIDGGGAFSESISGLLPGTTYFYCAMATNLGGTTVGSIQSFTTPAALPWTQASNITFSDVDHDGISVNWTNGDGARRVVKINTENSFTDPVNGTDPTAVNYSGLGEAVIYNSNGSSLSLDGDLYSGVTYYLRVYEFNGSGATTAFLTMTASGNPSSQTTDLAAITISDVTRAEADSGTTTFTFNVNKFGTAGGSVDWQVNAVAPTDGIDLPLPQFGTITIPPTSPGAGSLTPINVTVNGDTEFEPDETFTVNLSTSSTGLNIFDNQAVGTIQNDDPRTLVVDNTSDLNTMDECTAAANDCSLRGAVAVAQHGDTIDFDASSLGVESLSAATITLGGSAISIDNDITINGPGADQLTISGNNASGVFSLSGSTVVIRGLTIANGALTSGGGAGISQVGGSVTLDSVAVVDNTTTGAGGGIFCSGSGSIAITSSTISGNSVTGSGNGGGIQNNCVGTISISNSTISGNIAATNGGGIRSTNGTVIVTSSTITNNSATVEAGGLSKSGGTITVANSIIANNVNNQAIPDVAGDLISSGFNLIGNIGTATGFDSIGDQTGDSATPLDAKLGPLQNNGGPIHTRALLSGSPAIDQGSAFGSTIDQRGQPRPVDRPSITNAADGADIGAYELQAPTAASVSISGRVTTAYGSGIRGAMIVVTGMDGIPRAAYTNTLGYYRIDGLAVGESFVVTASARRYAFADPSSFISLGSDLTGMDFIAIR